MVGTLRVRGRCQFASDKRLAAAQQQIASRLSGPLAASWQRQARSLSVDVSEAYDPDLGRLVRDVLWDVMAHARDGAIAVEGEQLGRLVYLPGRQTEWRPDELPSGALARWGTMRFGHAEASAVAFSADGSLIASATGSRFGPSIRLWIAASGQLLHGLCLPPVKPRRGALFTPEQIGVCFSPDGRWLLSAGPDRALRRWEVASGALAATARHQSPLLSLGATVDRHRVAVAEAGGLVTLYDVDRFARIGQLRAGVDDVERVELDATSDSVAISGYRDSELRAVDSGELIATVSGHSQLCFVGSERLAALWRGRRKARVQLFARDGRRLRRTQQLDAPDGRFCRLIGTADGSELLIASTNGLARVDSAAGETRGQVVPWQGWSAEAIALSSDARAVAVVAEGRVHLLPAIDGEPAPTSWRPLRGVAAHPDGELLMLESDAGLHWATVADATPAAPIAVAGLRSWALSPAGDAVAVVTANKVAILAQPGGEQLASFGHRGTPSTVCFAAGGRLLIDDSRGIVVRDLARARRAALPGVGDGYLLAATPHSDLVAVGQHQAIELWNASTRKRLAQLETEGQSLNHALFDRGGERLYCCDNDGVSAWDCATGQLLWRDDGWGYRLALSVEGSRLAVSRHGTIAVLDAADGSLLSERFGHPSTAELSFVATGELISVGQQDGTLLRWKAAAPPAAPPAAAPPLRELIGSQRRQSAAQPRRAAPRPTLVPRERWNRRQWPSLQASRATVEQASAAAQCSTTRFCATGELVFADELARREALVAFDAHAYPEYFSAADFVSEGAVARIELDGEIAADCLAFDEAFEAAARAAVDGALEVRAGGTISYRRYPAGGGVERRLPALCPGCFDVSARAGWGGSWRSGAPVTAAGASTTATAS